MNFLEERKTVLEAAREISRSNLVTGTWGNVSARIKGKNLMVITPSGMDYERMEPEDLVLLDFEQKIIEGIYKPSVETPLHLNIYRRRPDIMAIVHVHAPCACAFAVTGKSIPVILEETAQVIGHEIQVAPYAHCGSEDLASGVGQALGAEKKAVLMANHGLIAAGGTMAEALKICYIAEKTARIAIYASSIGTVHALAEEDIRHLNQSFKHYGQHKA